MIIRLTTAMLIQIDANAQKQLAEDGYEPTMGARPLKRLFDE